MIRIGRLSRLAPLALALAGCTDEAAKAPSPPLVEVFTVAPALSDARRFTGTVRARSESALGFRVPGKIVERLVDPGERVRRGQTLLRLDKADLALALNAARANVEAARALKVKAEADERRSRDDSARIRDQARAAADAASAQLAAVAAQAAQAANQLAYAELQSDSDGVVLEVPADPGQVVAAGQPVIRLARDGAREAEIFLPEGSAELAGGEASATLLAEPGENFSAKLRERAAMADPATRSYRARYVLGGRGASAALGATVTVSLKPELRGRATAFAVPLGALFDNGGGQAVWKLDAQSGTVSLQPVTVARLREEQAEIGAGLAEGDRIVALGAHLLNPGQPVRVAPDALSAKVAEAGK